MRLDYLLKSSNRILFAPLNWGLGHATRSIPLIREALSQNKSVAIASDGLALEYLQHEFKNELFYELPSYNINYSGRSFLSAITKQIFKIQKTIRTEHNAVKSIIKQWNPDLIISDNRYGIYNSSVRSIIITHQLQPYFNNNTFQFIARNIINQKTKYFNEIWIPDFPDQRLSGSLSNSSKSNLRFIGPLSHISIDTSTDFTTDLLVLLSGPEPTRTILENSLLHLRLPQNTVLIRGTQTPLITSQNINFKKIIDLATGQELASEIAKSRKIICRSGYSSIMDLINMKERLLFIPTPGQTEQEYLAKHLNATKGISWVKENELRQTTIDQLVLNKLTTV